MRCAVGGGIIQMWRYENIWLPQLVWGLAASGSADLVPKPNPNFILVIPSPGGTLAIYLTLSSLRLGSEGEATLVERTRLGETSLLWSRPEREGLCAGGHWGSYIGLSSCACLSRGVRHLKRGRGGNLEASLLRGMPGSEWKQHFYVPTGQTVSVLLLK